MKRILLASLVLCLGNSISAAATQDPYVPPELAPWSEWVLHGETFRACPSFYNRAQDSGDFICAWAEPLLLRVDARGGRFDFRVRVDADSWFVLPGDADNFPQEVTVDGQPVAVSERGARPALWLTRGTRRISGRFSWAERPESLIVPAALTLLELVVDGQRVGQPEREADRLWLGQPRRPVAESDSLDVQVYRRLADGMPMLLESRLRVFVSGASREVKLGKALPEGFVPMSLVSLLPARLEPDGTLRLQARPGDWSLNLMARSGEVVQEVMLHDPEGPWAANEIWSYESEPRLRITQVRGQQPADPAQVGVPPQWQSLPAFVLVPGAALTIEERGRGMSEQEANRLSVSRSYWLDFDGGGMTAVDRLSGQMRRLWRLDMRAPFTLLSASMAGQNLLVTQGAEADMTGIELRSPAPDIEAISRVETGSIPVSGWTGTLDGLQAQVQLPPGYMLMAATGVDRSPGSWIERWRLLDYFLVLIIAVAIRRLYGSVAGLVALLALAVTFHEPWAPVWSWLNLVVALALAGAVKEGLFGRVARSYRNLSYLLVLALLVPFVANQLRLAIFPQLETVPIISVGGYGMGSVAEREVPEVRAPEEAMMRKSLESVAAAPGVAADAVREIVVTGQQVAQTDSMGYAPSALVQTGPGRPDWRWRSIRLGWDGPVSPGQAFRLILLKPWQTALWRVAGAVLAVVLFVLLLRTSFDIAGGLRRLRGGSAAAAVLCLFIVLPPIGEARAETPPQAVLDELRARLTAAPECMPQCASVPAARVDATAQNLVVELDIHTHARVAVPLPGQDAGWQADRFSVNGRALSWLYRDTSGRLWLPLDAGIHRVRLSGAMPARDSFQLPFPLPPREILASADGWNLAGIRNQRLVSGALELSRIRTTADSEQDVVEVSGPDRFPAFVRVTRNIDLGLDWRIATDVRRMAPVGGVVAMEIPLLPGESVVSQGVPVRDGKVSVELAAGETVFRWQSTLARQPEFSLSGPRGDGWTEVWRINTGLMWHADFTGTPVIMPAQLRGSLWIPEFYPRQGETLNIAVNRPEAVAGETLAIDRVSYIQAAGQNDSSFELSFDYRSTRGQQHTLTLPENAELERVTVDGQEQPLRLSGRNLNLPVVPGAHNVSLQFRVNQGVDWTLSQPVLALNAPASNLTLGFDLPRDRWVLFARGPALGPAVLYWAELVVFALLAWLLGKTTLTPLRTRDWLLLGLGFSTFSWGVLGLIGAWLFIMGWRARSPDLADPTWFNLRQLALAAISLVVLATWLSAIPMALLGNPDMHITGNGSSMHMLRWFSDRSGGETAAIAVFSTPLWFYKLLILLWSLWLSFALVRWLPWAWKGFGTGGFWAPMGPRGRRKPEPAAEKE